MVLDAESWPHRYAGWVGEAIFGLIGVVVGGLMTAGTELWRDRRRTKKERLIARKLLLAELLQARVALSSVAQTSHIPRLADIERFVPTTVWGDHRASLIEMFDDETWNLASRCFMMMEIEKAALTHAPDAAIRPQDAERTLKTVTCIDVLREMVKKLNV